MLFYQKIFKSPSPTLTISKMAQKLYFLSFHMVNACNLLQNLKVGRTSDQDIAIAFLLFSQSNFNARAHTGRKETSFPKVNQNWHHLFSSPFTDKEFQRSHRKLREKSVGVDNILPKLILELGLKANQTILLFINKTWSDTFMLMQFLNECIS